MKTPHCNFHLPSSPYSVLPQWMISGSRGENSDTRRHAKTFGQIQKTPRMKRFSVPEACGVRRLISERCQMSLCPESQAQG
jgi:hypothetical protein